MFNIPHEDRKPLSPLELQVLDTVWACGEATAERIREVLAEDKVLKESTVRTLLRRLEEKGYVQHRVEGRAYVYRGIEEPARLAGSAVGQIVERFCGGSVEQLLTGMVEAEVVDAAELERLARKIRRGAKEGG
jgi:predicted transcriptional regulator